MRALDRRVFSEDEFLELSVARTAAIFENRHLLSSFADGWDFAPDRS